MSKNVILEPSGSITEGEYLNQMSSYNLLKKNYEP
jgi:hypothetical protein